MSSNPNHWNHFEDDCNRGKRGESAWGRHLTAQGYVCSPIDIEEDKRGIDIRATKDELTLTFDVKNDGMAAKTGNLAFEFISRYHNGRIKDGWATKAACDFFVILEDLGDGRFNYHAVRASEVVAKLPEMMPDYRVGICRKDPNKETSSLLIKKHLMPHLFESYVTGAVKS